MKVLILFFCLSAFGGVAQTNETTGTIKVRKPVMESDSGTVYTTVEYMPEFPGGSQAMMDFVAKNVNYPRVAIDNALQGKCYVSFVVDTTGQLTDIRILKGIKDCPECDQEALRMVNSMPKWTPGRQNGRAVNVRFLVPINFKLQ